MPGQRIETKLKLTKSKEKLTDIGNRTKHETETCLIKHETETWQN